MSEKLMCDNCGDSFRNTKELVSHLEAELIDERDSVLSAEDSVAVIEEQLDGLKKKRRLLEVCEK